MEKKIQDWFTYTGAVLLFIIAIPILLAAKSRFDILSLAVRDPILFLANRQVLYLVSGLELALSAFLLLIKNRGLKLLVTMWLTANFLMYQALLWYQANSLGCLANLTNQLPILPNVYDRVALVILGWLLMGSISLLTREWWLNRRRTFHLKCAGESGERKNASEN